MYDGMMAETIRLRGDGDHEITGYLARPLGPGPFPGVVVIHHMPGYDSSTKEIVRTFATQGYNALCPNLHFRALPDGDPGEAARLTREGGGVPDEQCVGDVAGASEVLRSMITASGKVGVIGYCSGGRQSYLVACSLPFDAAVDCYGGRVAPAPEEITPESPPAVVELTASLSCPLLGLFGANDGNPSPEQTARIEAALRQHGKEYEFHTYEDAGHAFFSVDRPNFNVAAANDGWLKIWDFFGRHLADLSHAMPEQMYDPTMVTVVRDGYDRIAEQYTAQAISPGPNPRHEWLTTLLARLAPGSAVLDIGCGAGIPTGQAVVEAGHELTGIDLSPRQIELARDNVPAGAFFVADATEIEFGPSSFDAVTALFCLTHMPRELHAPLLARIHNWLTPDGLLLACLSTTDQPGWFEEDFLGLGGTSWTNGFDVETNRALLVDAGFTLVQTRVEEVDEPWGHEAWLWVLARRAQDR